MKRLLAAIALIAFARAAFATCDGTVTTNRGLCKPNHGSYVNNWETVLNPNYDLLDFSCSPPLSCASTTISVGTVGMANGGTGQTTTTKGDVLVGTGSAWAKLGVGSDGQALVSDSTQTNGVGWGSVGAGGGAPFPDSTSIVKGSSDPTKKARFEVDGFASGPTTHVYTLPDADGTIQLAGSSPACHWVHGSVAAERTGGTDFYMSMGGVGTSITAGDHFDMESVMVVTGHFTKTVCRAEVNPGATGSDGYDVKIYDDTVGVHASGPICQLRGSTKTCTATTTDTDSVPAARGVEYFCAAAGTAATNSIACASEFCPD